MKQIFSIVLVTLLIHLCNPTTIFAKGVTVSPSFQEIELERDVPEASASFLLKNDHEVPVEFEVFAYDFQQKDHFGSLALLDGFETAYAHTLASFLRFNEDRIVLEPTEEKEISVTIQNRDTLSPGGHYAAIIMRQVQNEGEIREVLPALSTLLLIRKTGAERFHLTIDRVDWNPSSVRFSIPDTVPVIFRNDGNTHVTPRGTVKFFDLFNRVTHQGIVNQDSVFVLPGTNRRIPIVIKSSRWNSPIMFVTMTLDGTTTPGDVSYRYEDSFLYIQPVALLGLIGAIGGLIFYIRKRRKSVLSA
ncbi:MAG: hypothetical protein WAU07_03360 [Microgenomates group bacterium]